MGNRIRNNSDFSKPPASLFNVHKINKSFLEEEEEEEEEEEL